MKHYSHGSALILCYTLLLLLGQQQHVNASSNINGFPMKPNDIIQSTIEDFKCINIQFTTNPLSNVDITITNGTHYILNEYRSEDGNFDYNLDVEDVYYVNFININDFMVYLNYNIYQCGTQFEGNSDGRLIGTIAVTISFIMICLCCVAIYVGKNYNCIVTFLERCRYFRHGDG
jgi:hypothetical protein